MTSKITAMIVRILLIAVIFVISYAYVRRDTATYAIVNSHT